MSPLSPEEEATIRDVERWINHNVDRPLHAELAAIIRRLSARVEELERDRDGTTYAITSLGYAEEEAARLRRRVEALEGALTKCRELAHGITKHHRFAIVDVVDAALNSTEGSGD